ncbi:MAG: TetR/AcrR family transcriptional regulator [Chitinophagaceae bacterium]|nr:MAG: TetR/AcrR family transcriptional regulator [Chitinophagaceae bacterium]
MARNVEFNEEKAIQKAMEVFWEKGYNGTSLRDLTEAMKINSSSLYNTIGDKQELFVRCVMLYTELRRRDMQKRLATSNSSFEILLQFIEESVDVIVKGDKSCMAIKSTFEMATNDPRIKEILKADNDYAYQFLYSLIKNSMAEGKISNDEDPALLADYFNSTWTGWNESFILHKDETKIRKMSKYFVRQITQVPA